MTTIIAIAHIKRLKSNSNVVTPVSYSNPIYSHNENNIYNDKTNNIGNSFYNEASIEENRDTQYRDVAPFPQQTDNTNTLSQYELDRSALGLSITTTPTRSDL